MSTIWIFVTICITLIKICAVNGNFTSDLCYSLDKVRNFSRQFASKTVYPLPENNTGQESYNMPGMRRPLSKLQHKSKQKQKISGCTPAKFWLLQRHGTRNPKKIDMRDYPYLNSVCVCDFCEN